MFASPAHPPAPDRRRHARGGDRRRVPAPARSPLLAAVLEAWRAACATFDPGHPGFAHALAAYARDGRARGVPVVVLLRALDALVRPGAGTAPVLNECGLRAHAGGTLIRAYFGDPPGAGAGVS